MFRYIVLTLAFIAGLGMATVVLKSMQQMEQLHAQHPANVADLNLHP